MNKTYFAFAIAVMCILGFGLSAHAQDSEAIVVSVPFEFVAGAGTLPAGTYRVGRLSQESRSVLALQGDTKTIFVLPKAFDEPSSTEAMLTFEHVGDKYFLGKIETPSGVYKLSTPRPFMAMAHGATVAVPAGGTK